MRRPGIRLQLTDGSTLEIAADGPQPGLDVLAELRGRPSPIAGWRRRGWRCIADLNRVLRGWGGYFRTGNAAKKFNQLDGYV